MGLWKVLANAPVRGSDREGHTGCAHLDPQAGLDGLQAERIALDRKDGELVTLEPRLHVTGPARGRQHLRTPC